MKKFFFLLLALPLVLTSCTKDDDDSQFNGENDREIILQYLADNNITATETALGTFVQTIEEGTGNMPSANSRVEVRYKGLYLSDEVVFDETADNNTTEFNMGGVIAGFRDGLETMRVGGTSVLYIPSQLGYGANPSNSIRRGAILIFEVELVGIV